MKVGEFLKKKRQVNGLTTRSLGEKAEVSFAYVSQLERGVCNPTLDTLDRLLKALDVGWIEFLTATGYVKPSKSRARLKP